MGPGGGAPARARPSSCLVGSWLSIRLPKKDGSGFRKYRRLGLSLYMSNSFYIGHSSKQPVHFWIPERYDDYHPMTTTARGPSLAPPPALGLNLVSARPNHGSCRAPAHGPHCSVILAQMWSTRPPARPPRPHASREGREATARGEDDVERHVKMII